MITIDLYSRVPIYEQLSRKIIELVLLGELKTGDQLPSVRGLARDLGINPNTVQKAYQDLERDGVIYTQLGRGNFVGDLAPLTKAQREKAARQLQTALQEAKRAGLQRPSVLLLVDEIYHEGATEHD